MKPQALFNIDLVNDPANAPWRISQAGRGLFNCNEFERESLEQQIADYFGIRPSDIRGYPFGGFIRFRDTSGAYLCEAKRS